MRRRQNTPEGISPLAWAYLHDMAEDDHPGWEFSTLESGHHDHSMGYSTSELWSRYGAEIVANWIKRRPGCRPWCWWRFNSGLPYVSRPDPTRPFEIIEDRRPYSVLMWLCRRDPQNVRRKLTDDEFEAMRGEIIMDQREWLATHGFLQAGEK